MDVITANSDVAVATAPAAADVAPARTAASVYAFAQMRLKVGDQLHLEPPRRIAGGRTSVIVVGWFEGQSIIVTAPQNETGRVVLQEGELVLMRAFTGKSAFAFRAITLKAAYLPFAYLHLSFPDKVDGVEIRTSPRCRVRIPAAIATGGSAKGQGNILNIGTHGALIEIAIPLNQSESMIQLAFSIELHGVPVTLKLNARVCGAKSAQAGGDPPSFQYGVEFKNLQPNDRLALGSLVWYELYENPRNAV